MANARQVAEWVGGTTCAEGGTVARVAAPDQATGDAVVLAANAEALQSALDSSAGLVLTTHALAASTSDPRIVIVADPRLAFSIVAAELAAKVAAHIHPSAVVDATARVGANTSIAAGAVVGAGVVIGSGCRIGPRVVLEQGITLGDRVVVQAGAVLGSLGFGYARRPDGSYLLFPQQGTLVVEDDVEIGANSTIDRGALGETRIGAGTKIDNLVHVGHNCRIGRNVILAAQTGISGSSVIEDGAILGGQVGVGEHAVVGTQVILGGGAGVLSNKKLRGAGQVFWGRPAQPLKQYLRDLARLRKGK